ncbi:hypothetical protein Tco_0134763 [Tanacetum coccineum]
MGKKSHESRDRCEKNGLGGYTAISSKVEKYGSGGGLEGRGGGEVVGASDGGKLLVVCCSGGGELLVGYCGGDESLVGCCCCCGEGFMFIDYGVVGCGVDLRLMKVNGLTLILAVCLFTRLVDDALYELFMVVCGGNANHETMSYKITSLSLAFLCVSATCLDVPEELASRTSERAYYLEARHIRYLRMLRKKKSRLRDVSFYPYPCFVPVSFGISVVARSTIPAYPLDLV